MTAPSRETVSSPSPADHPLTPTIVEMAMDGFFMIDADGGIHRPNAAATTILGYSRKQLEQMRIPDIDVAESPEELQQHIRHVHAQGSDRFETIHRRADGKCIDVEVSASVSQLPEGPMIFAFFRDISAVKADRRERARQSIELQKCNEALVALSKSEAIASGDLTAAFREITRLAARTMDVQRVGIWLFENKGRSIRCECLYELSHDSHSWGTVIHADTAPRYFEAVGRERYVAAHDARTDPRTNEFTDTYLKPLGITSLMDAIVRQGDQPTALICHEHVGPARTWSATEQVFAGSMADFVAMAMQVHDRRRAQQAIEQQARLQALLTEIAASFINCEADEVHDNINDALRRLGEHTGVDRCFVFELAPDESAATMTHEWRAPGIASRIGTAGEHFTAEQCPWMQEQLREGIPICLNRIDEIRRTAPSEHEILRRLNVQSLLLTPMTVRDRVVGTFGLETNRQARKWSTQLVGVAPLFGEVLVSALQRLWADERQNRLIRELDHRVKNNLASVIALAEHTLRTSDSLDSFRDAFIGRVAAMARMHEMLAELHWSELSVRDVARFTLGAFMEGNQPRLRLHGDRVLLPASVALPLTLTVHELATNAMKHGALSNSTGSIDLHWHVDEDHRLHMTWQERGGPPPQEPLQQGTGRALIRGFIEYELHGKLDFAFKKDGVCCSMVVPTA